MKLLWWRRTPEDPRPEVRVDDVLDTLLRGVLSDLHRNPVRVNHVIERKTPPRPTVIQPVFRNQLGQEYRTIPINATLRHTVPVYFPLAWVTGKEEDNSVQCGLELELFYEPERR